jgi:hypothetical protein
MGERAGLIAKQPEAKKEISNSHVQKTARLRSMGTSADRIRFLQRTAGNRAVSKLIRSEYLQAKLWIGQPGDIYEQEADRVADEVIRMSGVQQQVKPEEEETLQSKPRANQITPLVQVQRQEGPEKGETLHAKPHTEKTTPLVQRQVGGEEEEPIEELEEEEEPIMTKAFSNRTKHAGDSLHVRLNRSRGGGQPLSDTDRNFMETRFGVDFSDVRVHANSNAIQMSRELNAQAFTHGRDIYFGADKYITGLYAGKKLLAHELTHVVQQRKLRNLQMSSETSKGTWIRQGPGNTELTFMSNQQLPHIRQIISSDVVARNWQPGRREEGELAGVPGGLDGYVRRIQRLLRSGSERPLNLTGVLETALSPMRQRTRLDSAGQPNAEDAQDLRQFFDAYPGGVSAFVESLCSSLEVIATVSGRRAYFPGETEDERRRGARSWLVEFTQAIARTYPAITATVEEPARRLFDIGRAESERTLESAEETRRERVEVNQLISGSSIQRQWLTYWRGQYLNPSNNREMLAKWLLDRWNHTEINLNLGTARWEPNHSLTGNEDYRNSFAVINEVARRLGSTVYDGREAGNRYFSSIYDNYYEQLRQLGCDLTNYLLPRSSEYLAAGAFFDRPAFVNRMDAWGRLSLVPRPSGLPHHVRIRAMFSDFNSYRGREIPGSEFARHMTLGSHTYPSGIHCDTNGCRFPISAIP